DRLRALFTVAIGLGLRRGEIVGLRWEHVDLDKSVLRVVQQLQRVKGVGLVASEPKSAKGKRRLKLPPRLTAELREHRRRQQIERLAAGPKWTDSGYVFTTTTGAPLDGRNLLRRWKRALRD